MSKTIVWMIMFFVALACAIVCNWFWYKSSEKLNEDWYELAINQNDNWAELCKKIEAERDALRERVAKLETERGEE